MFENRIQLVGKLQEVGADYTGEISLKQGVEIANYLIEKLSEEELNKLIKPEPKWVDITDDIEAKVEASFSKGHILVYLMYEGEAIGILDARSFTPVAGNESSIRVVDACNSNSAVWFKVERLEE